MVTLLLQDPSSSGFFFLLIFFCVINECIQRKRKLSPLSEVVFFAIAIPNTIESKGVSTVRCQFVGVNKPSRYHCTEGLTLVASSPGSPSSARTILVMTFDPTAEGDFGT